MEKVPEIKLTLKTEGTLNELALLTDNPNNVFKCTSFETLEIVSKAVNAGVLGRVNTDVGFKFYLMVDSIQHELNVGDAIAIGSDGKLYPLPKRLLQDLYNVYTLV